MSSAVSAVNSSGAASTVKSDKSFTTKISEYAKKEISTN